MKEIPITIAQMRTINLVLTWIYYTTDVGKEGDWRYMSTDTTSADNGIDIIVDNAGHRWYKIPPTSFLDTALASANYVWTNATYVTLPDLAGQANRTVALPNPATATKEIIIRNLNTAASTFNWSPSGFIVADFEDIAITTFAPITTYRLVSNGTKWTITN